MKSALDLIDGKNISKAKMLLKVDCEFLRRVLPSETLYESRQGAANNNKSEMSVLSDKDDLNAIFTNAPIRTHYAQSIESMQHLN